MKKLLTFFFLLGFGAAVIGQTLAPESDVYRAEKVVKATYFEKMKPLRDTEPITPGERKRAWKNDLIGNATVEKPPFDLSGPENVDVVDPAVQEDVNRDGDYWPIRSFMGLGNVNGYSPPDTDGVVGPDHYFLIINSSFAIYSKEGMQLYGPADNSTLWDGFPGPWTGTNDGDPIVLYDELADRWFASQFAVNTSNGTFWELVAISETGDPLGAWYRYAFQFNYFNDYPKFGVWPNAYIGTFNYFNSSASSYIGGGAVALDREAMINGDPDAEMIVFPISGSKYGILPADFDGTPPPANEPAWFAHINRTGDKKLEIWKADINWSNPASSTYSLQNSLTVDAFNASVGSIPQPGTSQTLDAIGGQLMFRLQYRNFGSYSTLVANHTVTASARAAIRWYELRKETNNWSVYQQGTWKPDNDFRWMGSIAMNGNGNIAVGYSVSSSETYPSIRYTGRTANAPLGTFNMPEVSIVEGVKSQTNLNRWGDYSAMSVDPSNDSTFWYTQMYISGSNWRTHIASFDFALGLPPSIEVGADQYMCINQNTISTTTTGIGIKSVLWTTSGDGIFLYNDRMTTIFAPGGNDRISGSTSLTIEATGHNGNVVIDSFMVYINDFPRAIAGNDTIICKDQVIELYGMANFADSTIWTTNGDGTFSDANLLNAVYSPGTQDITNGTVELTLSVFAEDVCVGQDSDKLVLTVDNCTGIQEIDLQSAVTISPNPSNGQFSFVVENPGREKLSWELHDASGKVVMTSERASTQKHYSEKFDLSAFAKGIYLLNVRLGAEQIAERIVIR
ncbi:MAG: T9SS type A sorting domain-containing protein [Bacteroidales bacterium]|nr:T9SS type A sorting domain-containing protein [Bacteroidales bacterium]